MRLSKSDIFVAAALLALFCCTACSTGGGPAAGGADDPAGKMQERIKPMVEALYLQTKELEAIYLDLRTVARAHAFLPDDLQLSHIQKAALYVQNALQGAFHQWEFLSIMDDIKPAAVRDYYTLRHQAMKEALDETASDVRFLKLYQAYITSAEAQTDIGRALSAIEEIQKTYGQLIEAIAPLVRQARPALV
jgi:hypothetical protein